MKQTTLAAAIALIAAFTFVAWKDVNKATAPIQATDPNKAVTLTLPAWAWAEVFEGVKTRSYNVAQPLLAEMYTQYNYQMKPAADTTKQAPVIDTTAGKKSIADSSGKSVKQRPVEKKH